MVVSSSYSDRIMYFDPKGSNRNRAAVLRPFLVDPSQIVPLGKGPQVTANAVYLLWYAKIPSGSHLTEMLALVFSASLR